jgi:hypothetical protein
VRGQHEIVTFAFEASPSACRIHRYWQTGLMPRGRTDELLARVKKAFMCRARLRDAAEGKSSLTIEHRSPDGKMLPISDIDFAAALMAMDLPLFAPQPLTRKKAAAGEAVTFNFESNDAATASMAVWAGDNLRNPRPNEPLDFIKLAFFHNKNLRGLMPQKRPVLVLQGGGWTYQIPKSEKNDGSEVATLRKLIEATKHCPYRG